MSLNFKALQQLSKGLSLLYIEDDKPLRDKTAVVFTNLFKRVDVAKDGLQGLEVYEKYHKENSFYYDIVVSDIQMPCLDGIGLTKKILEIHPQQKIIIISAYNDKEYLIDLINLGVEGFLQKPLSSQNLLKTLYDTCSSLHHQDIITIDENYTYNNSISALFCDDQKVDLSEKEMSLLELLIKNKNKIFSAIEIFNHIYIDEPQKDFSTDSVKSLIKRLRKKLPEGFIRNTQQLGYSASY